MALSVQKVGPKGQVTLPKHVRDALGLKTGDLVETVLGREGAITRPVELRLKKVDVKKRLEAAERAVKEGRGPGPLPSAGAPLRGVAQYAPARRSHLALCRQARRGGAPALKTLSEPTLSALSRS